MIAASSGSAPILKQNPDPINSSTGTSKKSFNIDSRLDSILPNGNNQNLPDLNSILNQHCKQKQKQQHDHKAHQPVPIATSSDSTHSHPRRQQHRSSAAARSPLTWIPFILLLLIHFFYQLYLFTTSSTHSIKRLSEREEDLFKKIEQQGTFKIPTHLALVLSSPPQTRTRFLVLRSLFGGSRRSEGLEESRIKERERAKRKEMESLIRDARNLILWSGMIGVKEVSVYDKQGILKNESRRNQELFNEISIKRRNSEREVVEFNIKVKPFIKGMPISSEAEREIIPTEQEFEARALRKRRKMGIEIQNSASSSSTPPEMEEETSVQMVYIKLNLLSSIDGQPSLSKAASQSVGQTSSRIEGLKQKLGNAIEKVDAYGRESMKERRDLAIKELTVPIVEQILKGESFYFFHLLHQLVIPTSFVL